MKVTAPGEDVRGLTPLCEALQGKMGERRGLHHGLINVKYSSTDPNDACVSVFYRGQWLFIADEDVRSKAYFVLVGTRFSLQAGDLCTVQPLLRLFEGSISGISIHIG